MKEMKEIIKNSTLVVLLISSVYLSIMGIAQVNNSIHKQSTDWTETTQGEKIKKSVLVLPLNSGINETYMKSALTMLEKQFPNVNIIVGEKTKLPKNCLNYKGSRYRADSILLFLDKIKPDSIDKVIGLTSSDISITRTLIVNGEKKVYPDRGIFGLGRRPGTVCVVSNYRTGTVETFSKTTVHEFMHTLGVPHCEHKNCIMQDGKGSGKNMRESTHTHKDCYELALKGF